MSIATAITNLQGKIANAYTAIENKGGTLPATQDAQNLATAIEDIPSGGGDAKRKYGATIDEVYYNPTETSFKLNGGVENLNFTGIETVAHMPYAFYGSTSLKSVSFPALLSVSLGVNNIFEHTFENCTNLSSASFPEFEKCGQYTFSNAFINSGVKSAIWPKLNFASSYAFINAYNNSQVEEASFPLLSDIGINVFEGAFANCSKLSSISFPEVSRIGLNGFLSAFKGCTLLTSFTLPNLSICYSLNALQNTCVSCTELISASFPMLKTVNGNKALSRTFEGCTKLSSVSLPELETIEGMNVMDGFVIRCSALSSLAFPKLKVINGALAMGAMTYGTSITTLSFPELTAIYSSGNNTTTAPFYNNVSVTRMDFPKLTVMSTSTSDATNSRYLFNNCTNLAEIHFGAENQSIIESAQYYSTKWGAPSDCQIYFDL